MHFHFVDNLLIHDVNSDFHAPPLPHPKSLLHPYVIPVEKYIWLIENWYGYIDLVVKVKYFIVID